MAAVFRIIKLNARAPRRTIARAFLWSGRRGGGAAGAMRRGEFFRPPPPPARQRSVASVARVRVRVPATAEARRRRLLPVRAHRRGQPFGTSAVDSGVPSRLLRTRHRSLSPRCWSPVCLVHRTPVTRPRQRYPRQLRPAMRPPGRGPGPPPGVLFTLVAAILAAGMLGHDVLAENNKFCEYTFNISK